jgi:xanthosine utilization system XapX-like protein
MENENISTTKRGNGFWGVMTALLPTVKMLLLVGVIFTLFSFAYHAPPVIRFLLYRKREWLGIVPLYQLLFSKGILNPKIP